MGQLMRYFTDNQAAAFMRRRLAEDNQGFSDLVYIRYIETTYGRIETCGGCTLGDGRDCRTPLHYEDIFLAVCEKKFTSAGKSICFKRYSNLSMGWSEGGHDCSNAFMDFNEVTHYKYEDDRKIAYSSYESIMDALEKKLSPCKRCGGQGSYAVQVGYASYQSGHQLGEDTFETQTCPVCEGLGKVFSG